MTIGHATELVSIIEDVLNSKLILVLVDGRLLHLLTDGAVLAGCEFLAVSRNGAQGEC